MKILAACDDPKFFSSESRGGAALNQFINPHIPEAHVSTASCNSYAPDCNSKLPPIGIRTLGRFEILIAGEPLEFERRAPMRCLQLLAALAAYGGRSVSITRLCDLLWPDSDGDDAYGAFTTTLHRLRRVLRDSRALRLSAARLSIDPQRCHLDIWALERGLQSARDVNAIDAVLAEYPGAFLGDDDTAWAVEARARLSQQIAVTRRRVEVAACIGRHLPVVAADVGFS